MGKIYTRGGNPLGLKWNKGGKLARKRRVHIDFNETTFMDLIAKLEKLEADIPEIIGQVMEEVAQQVADDTRDAIQKQNLPADGIYSIGETEKSIIDNPRVTWEGPYGSVPLGFDKTKRGHGTLLITGTPQMRPVFGLFMIFTRKNYQNEMKKKIEARLQEEIDRRL